jgi:geranylgeranyl reductase family protein
LVVERFDVLVVGGGPAGSTAAYRLARSGASVLLADRARFPRDKPCGGALTYRAVRQLPVAIDPVVEDVVERFELRLGYRLSFERTAREPLCLMTQRRWLDAHLAEQAVAAGADFRDAAKVADIEISEDRVAASVGGRPVEARVLVGADGVNGATAKALGLGADYTHGVALEGNAPYSSDRYRGRLVLELGVIPGGYGWVFPKGDHVNIGIGGWESQGPTLRERLAELCEQHSVSPSDLTDVRGYRLPLRRPTSALVKGPAALVGDAAGLVDPLTGDGIYEALLSARLASEAAVDVLEGRAADLSGYERAMTQAVGSLARTAWRAKRALDRFPRLFFAAARLPPTWSAIELLVRGDLASPADARGLSRAPLRFIEALAGRAPDSAAADAS